MNEFTFSRLPVLLNVTRQAKRSNCFRFSFLHGGWSEPRHRANSVEQEHLQPTIFFLLPNSIQNNSQFFSFFLFKSITHSIEHLLLMLRHCVVCAWFVIWFSLLISFCFVSSSASPSLYFTWINNNVQINHFTFSFSADGSRSLSVGSSIVCFYFFIIHILFFSKSFPF